jgi:hypothetical protein
MAAAERGCDPALRLSGARNHSPGSMEEHMEEVAWPKLLAALFGFWSGEAPPADDPQYAAAAATIREYAKDMSTIMPCAYLRMSAPGGRHDVADESYGYAAVRQVVVRYSNDGRGGFPESLALVQVFAASYKPKWSVKDIRPFARNCFRTKLLGDDTTLGGAALPLASRPPFMEERSPSDPG